jgi:hypothetical protein
MAPEESLWPTAANTGRGVRSSTFYSSLQRYFRLAGLPPAGVHIFRHAADRLLAAPAALQILPHLGEVFCSSRAHQFSDPLLRCVHDRGHGGQKNSKPRQPLRSARCSGGGRRQEPGRPTCRTPSSRLGVASGRTRVTRRPPYGRESRLLNGWEPARWLYVG